MSITSWTDSRGSATTASRGSAAIDVSDDGDREQRRDREADQEANEQT
jgi:hypothetical protein